LSEPDNPTYKENLKKIELRNKPSSGTNLNHPQNNYLTKFGKVIFPFFTNNSNISPFSLAYTEYLCPGNGYLNNGGSLIGSLSRFIISYLSLFLGLMFAYIFNSITILVISFLLTITITIYFIYESYNTRKKINSGEIPQINPKVKDKITFFVFTIGLILLTLFILTFNIVDNSFDASTAINEKGVVLMKRGDYDEALKTFDEALKINPSSSLAWYNKGVVLYELERDEEAIEAYNQAIKFNPNDIDALNNKGIILGDLGKYQESIDLFNRALAIDPKYGHAWYNKGLALEEIGRKNEATEAYKQAVKYNPELLENFN